MHILIMEAKWKMVKRIVGLCHQHNGTIFGGAARDSYIHDHDARKFCQKYDISQYQDTEITEFSGRFTVPNDVDCILLASDHKTFLAILHQKFHVKNVLDVDAHYFSGLDIPPDEYRYKRYSVVDLHDVPLVLQLDVIIQVNGDRLIYPFQNIDMDVNALLWTKDSMMVNPDEVRSIGLLHGIYTPVFGLIYTTLFENILLKKAMCTSTCSARRIHKMKQHGWEVSYAYETIRISNAPYEGVCVLCQETIEGDHSTFECKCAQICMECLKKHHAAIPRCTICKAYVNQERLENEIRIYKAIQYTPALDVD